MALPSGVRNASSRSGALRSAGLKPRMPSRASVAFMRLMIRRALAHQAFALAARTLGVLFLDRRDRDHPAVASLAPQPAQEHAHQHRGIQPVGLCPAVFARHRDARGMDDVHLDAASLQPPGQPKSVASRLIGEDDPFDRLAHLHRLGPPALQQLVQIIGVRLKLLQGLTINARNHSSHQPARLAHFNNHYQLVV